MNNSNTYTDQTPRYRIKAVGLKTGIPPITLRAWERRYQVLLPRREQNRYRLYSEADIQGLKWLKDQVDMGVTISQAAAELRSLISNGEQLEVIAESRLQGTFNSEQIEPSVLAERLYFSLVKHDESAAQAIFEQAMAGYPLLKFFEEVINPFLIRLGEGWWFGKVTISTEHFASNFILTNLMSIYRRLPLRKCKAKILIGGAPGELHTLGSLMMSILLREAGYFVEFMGPDLPLDDLIMYCNDEKPKMVMISAFTGQAALSLRGFNGMLAQIHQPPIFAYGGGAFSIDPTLVEQIPGIYLGNTISLSLMRVKQLI